MKTRFSRSALSKSNSELLVLPVFGQGSDADSSVPQKSKKQTGKDPIRSFNNRSVQELKAFDSVINGGLNLKLKKLEFEVKSGKRLAISLVTDKSGSKSAKSAGGSRILRVAVMSAAAKAPKGLGTEEWRKLGGDTAQQARAHNVTSISLSTQTLEGNENEALRAFFEGFYFAQYSFTNFKSNKKNPRELKVREFEIVGDGSAAPALKAATLAKITADGASFSRDLINSPPNAMQPRDLVAVAKKIAKSSRGKISIKVFDKRALERMKAKAILAVSWGSDSQPYMLHMTFHAGARTKKRKQVVLVGKGVTFDSGGLSIKPGAGMMTMKSDMSGAACCLGIMSALPDYHKISPLDFDLHVVIPTTENLLGGSAMRPGDIVRAMNGKTIEVLNTDAEGRLILADALSYSQRINADVTIDIATLTGAVAAALGNEFAGIFTDQNDLATAITVAGEAGGEKYWRLPLAKEYRPYLESPVADLQNISNGTGPAGATIGALFLKEFADTRSPWVHLDIAGTAFNAKTNEYYTGGAAAFGVRTFLRYFDNGAPTGKTAGRTEKVREKKASTKASVTRPRTKKSAKAA